MSNLVESTFGPSFIGFTISLSFYGTILAQAIFYFASFLKDSWVTKTLVITLCVLETFHVYLLNYTFWTMLVSGHATFALTRWKWEHLTLYGIAFAIIFIVQIYFCIRVWRVSAGKAKLATFLIAITAAIQLGSGMAFMDNSIRHRSPQDIFNHEGHTTARIELISAMVCDLVISTALVYYFYIFRIGTQKMNAILHQLIFISVNMGVLLCVVTAVNLALFEYGSWLSLPPHIILSKLYVNSLIATLNARKHMRTIANRTVEISFPTMDDAHSSDIGSKSMAV